MNFYVSRDELKASLGIPATATADHWLLDIAIEGVSRTIETHVGYPFYPASGTRYYTPSETTRLLLDTPIVGVDAINLDNNGDSTFETVMAATGYNKVPYNATDGSPRQPWWQLEVRYQSSAVFPVGLQRSVQIVGTWGYYNETENTTVTLDAAVNATVETLTVNGATGLHAGQTILVDGERMFVRAVPINASGATGTSSGITVTRGVNGTSGAAHTSGAGVQVYTYPVVNRAALFQAAMDFRAKDAPMGAAGGDPFGTQRITAPGGLHPFTRRLLEPFRSPVAR